MEHAITALKNSLEALRSRENSERSAEQKASDEAAIAELESAISKLDPNCATGKRSFGHAVEAMKQGRRVARSGWNGKGMFVYYVPEAKYPAQRNEFNTMVGVFPDDMVPYQAYMAMKTAQDTVVPWLVSQSDALADDWMIVE